MIVTGDLPILSYVLDRVAEDEVPLLRTKLDTRQTVAAIEQLYGKTPFTSGAEKVARADELFAALDVAALFS
jgi:hypothetical protein